MGRELRDEKLIATVNINVHAYVRLTDYGRAVFHAHHAHAALDIAFNDAFPRPNATPLIDSHEFLAMKTTPDGWVQFMFWELMHIFGDAMYIGNTNNTFENNNIRLEESL